MAYREAEVFFWDSASLANATDASIARIDVFVKNRPSSNNNQSGLNNPGATMFLVPTINAIPDLSNILTAPRSRLEYSELPSTLDANTPASFKFEPPVNLPCNQNYALIMHYDGDEVFELWKDVKGEVLVGTTQISPGHPQRDVGSYFTFLSTVPTPVTNTVAISNSTLVTSGSAANTTTVANTTYALSNWTATAGVSLKFKIWAARYAVNGDHNLGAYVNAVSTVPNTVITTTSNSVTNLATGTVQFTIPARRYEYCIYNRSRSFTDNVLIGERCFQRLPLYPNEGTPYRVSCVAGSDVITCPDRNFDFTTLFLKGGLEKEHIVTWSFNHDGPHIDRCHVRQVIECINAYAIRVETPCVFTNLSCSFHRAPVGVIDSIGNTYCEDVCEPLLTLRDSCANSTIRFSNHCFHTISITAAGNTYSNSDVITFGGYESVAGAVIGGRIAVANCVTDSNGAIVQVYFSDLGCGFVNTAAITTTVANSTGGNSSGTGFVANCNIGAVYRAEFLGQLGYGGIFSDVRLTNIDIDRAGWIFDMHQPAGSFYEAQHSFPYYSIDNANCWFGRSFHCDGDANIDTIPVQQLGIQDLRSVTTKRRCLPSWSAEVVITYEANGSSCNAAGCSQNSVVATPPGTSNSVVLVINTVANGDYSSVTLNPNSSTVTFSKWIINNDYTGEETNSGNALAKGIENKITFANDHFAEDIRVYLTAYRPSNTDIQVYARIYNSHDGDAFDDKDWTRLEVKDGGTIFSSSTNADDYIEITYGFQSTPNVATTFVGTVTTQLSNAVITGSGTTLNTLAVGNLVKIYQPLFPNTYQVAVVSTITNATSITLNDTISNNGMVGSGLIIQSLGFPNQAFNNYLNDNVVRYYNTSMVPFDTYNTFQLKLVLLSDSDTLVPRIDDCRAVGTSS